MFGIAVIGVAMVGATMGWVIVSGIVVFEMLGVGVAVTEMRCRSMFYTSLGRLLMVDLGEDEEKFDAFMMPLTQSFESLGQVLNEVRESESN